MSCPCLKLTMCFIRAFIVKLVALTIHAPIMWLLSKGQWMTIDRTFICPAIDIDSGTGLTTASCIASLSYSVSTLTRTSVTPAGERGRIYEFTDRYHFFRLFAGSLCTLVLNFGISDEQQHPWEKNNFRKPCTNSSRIGSPNNLHAFGN